MSDSDTDSDAPSVEHLFDQAFTEPNPGPALQKIVDDRPSYTNIEFPLIKAYFDAASTDPSRANILAGALAGLGPDTLKGAINRELARSVHFVFRAVPEDTAFGPSNPFLLHSLLSGLSLKYSLTQTSAMYSAIEKGLEPTDVEHPLLDALNAEVLVVGACIQVLLAGSVLASERAGTYRRTAEVVAENLRDSRDAGRVKDPRAVNVLNLAIEHAETGLRKENEMDDVWNPLFRKTS
ncbi:hypothetical protein CPC08DRAFT_754314 [Agrocybe pediades]|nr:hypothetical protein CPC08DRAFT_754314 [Agrocybe pediades]